MFIKQSADTLYNLIPGNFQSINRKTIMDPAKIIGGPNKLRRAPISILPIGTLTVATSQDASPEIKIKTIARGFFNLVFILVDV